MQHAPPLGHLYDVEGRSLLLHRSGTGGPAVVFVPGAGMVGLDYLNLHNRVAEFTTSVLYDRAGTGWSDPVDLPRPGIEVVEELHTMLRAAGVPAPYVLVGHSLGGVYVRRYAQLFPDEVAGLVMLEPAHEDWDTYMPEDLHLSRHVGDEQPLPEFTPELREKFRGLISALFAQWPEPVRAALVEHRIDPATIQAGMREQDNLIEILDEIRAAGGTPDVPLIVFSGQGLDPAQALFLSEQQLQQQNEGKLALYDAVAGQVTRGEHRVIDHAGHSWMQVQGEEAVLRGIRDLIKG